MMLFPFSALIILAYIGIFSYVASARSITLPSYWAGTGAALLPWLIAVCIILTIASVMPMPEAKRQSATMAALLPSIGMVFIALLAPIISIFLSSDFSLWQRVKWMGLISAIPALLITVALVWIIIIDS
jgi:hypothetical protein